MNKMVIAQRPAIPTKEKIILVIIDPTPKMEETTSTPNKPMAPQFKAPTITRIKEMGLNEEDYGFYLDLRKYGSARHAGFGLGFERCVMYLTGMGNIRDVIPFPRTVNNCEL